MSLLASAPWEQVRPVVTSTAFWAAVGVFVAAVAIRFNYRSSHPRRRLTYSFSVLPLFARQADGEGAGSLVEVSFVGVPVKDPRLVALTLVNTGSKDIASAHFDGNVAMRLELGTRALCLFATEAHPATSRPPTARISTGRSQAGHQAVLVAPGRLGKGASVTYTVLVEGQPKLSFRHNLIDVEVKEGSYLREINQAIERGENLDCS
ncbi:hypothetical protein [Streptomyces corynorhini]|uniref:hypothetical protein n=1 Tax=Streptomyces corynorhini TaxID=2282652 RepID=UPI0011C065F1|nr:hypothetical protein [Streptomyces corynorhini]